VIAFEQFGLVPRQYFSPRGRCPRCDSHAVTHLVIGMPANVDDMQWAQHWVVSVGCHHPGHDRECSECGLGWTGEAADEAEMWTDLTGSLDE